MGKDNDTLAGLLLGIGAAQFMTVMMLMEAIAPGYSMHTNAISDLGVIPETSLLFTLTMVFLAACVVASGYLFTRKRRDAAFLTVSVLGGIGIAGAGIISLDSPLHIHGLFALMAFLFLNLEAVLCYRHFRGPIRTISVLAGAIGLIFLVLMAFGDAGDAGAFGAIGHGGIERMIAYPGLIWMMILGGYLIAVGEREK